MPMKDFRVAKSFGYGSSDWMFLAWWNVIQDIQNCSLMIIKKFIKFIICGAMVCMALQGCNKTKVIQKGSINSLHTDTTVALIENNQESPNCHVTLDFMYLQPSSTEDSLSMDINKILQRTTFGTDFQNMPPQTAITTAQKQYITTYRKDLLSFYEADLKSGIKKDEMPPWYNHEYNIVAELSLSKDSIYNYTVSNYQYTGGAHPNTFASWTNINANTGKELKRADVFTDGSDKAIIQLIEKHLLSEVNNRLETDTITTIQGLWDNGVLLNVDLYVPENFLITDDGVKFLYNRYDIAPYVMGDFELNIPYAEIENLMKIK